MNMFIKGHYYSRREISQNLGGGEQEFLPNKDGKILCLCVTSSDNPHLPDKILVGKNGKIPHWGRVFFEQNTYIPMYVKRNPSNWEYIGNYKASDLSEDPSEVAKHARYSGRSDILFVLTMNKE